MVHGVRLFVCRVFVLGERQAGACSREEAQGSNIYPELGCIVGVCMPAAAAQEGIAIIINRLPRCCFARAPPSQGMFREIVFRHSSRPPLRRRCYYTYLLPTNCDQLLKEATCLHPRPPHQQQQQQHVLLSVVEATSKASQPESVRSSSRGTLRSQVGSVSLHHRPTQRVSSAP